MNGKVEKVPAVWKLDKEFGYAYFCSRCHRFICVSKICKCGAYVDLSLPAKQYTGRVKWEGN